MCQLAMLQKRGEGSYEAHGQVRVLLSQGWNKGKVWSDGAEESRVSLGSWLRDESAEESLRDLVLSEGRSR